jgi:hypothetical protein
MIILDQNNSNLICLGSEIETPYLRELLLCPIRERESQMD